MAQNERRRQKALARKKARKEARRRGAQARTGAFQRQLDGVSKSAIRNAPIHECLCSDTIKEQGLGYLIVARKLPGDTIVIGLYLLDIYCLGAKDAFLRVFGSIGEYENFKGKVRESMPLTAVSAAYSAKLINGAVDYARTLGFAPPRDFDATSIILADVNPAECTDKFEFGKDGKPFYLRGPGEDEARAVQIVKQLTARLGADGFDFVAVAPDTDFDEDGDAELEGLSDMSDLSDESDESDLSDDDEPTLEADVIAEELLRETPTAPVAPPPAVTKTPEPEKPKGFFGRLFKR